MHGKARAILAGRSETRLLCLQPRALGWINYQKVQDDVPVEANARVLCFGTTLGFAKMVYKEIGE